MGSRLGVDLVLTARRRDALDAVTAACKGGKVEVVIPAGSGNIGTFAIQLAKHLGAKGCAGGKVVVNMR